MNNRGLIKGPTETEEAFCARSQGKGPPISCAPFPFTLDWVPVTRSSKGLPFWEGAALWIEESGACRIQIKKSWGYDEEELLAHEGVHAARVAFNEPRFEEILAYQTSKSRLRKYWGPLFRSPKETLLLLGLLSASIPLQFFTDLPLFLAPVSLLLGYAVRLMRAQHIFTHCLKTCPLETLVQMTDREIEDHYVHSR